MDAVEVVVHGILAHHQVSDVQLGTEGAGNAGIHQVSYAEGGAEALGAEGGVDLAHTALDNDGGEPLQHPLIKGAAGNFFGCGVFHRGDQGFHLRGHSADDSEFFHRFPPDSVRIMEPVWGDVF